MRYRALLAALIAQGVSGLAGGFGLAGDPSGESVGLPLAWLEGTPFPDYRVPGLILFFVLGIVPLIVAWGVWKRRRWGWYGSLGVGAALAIWILVEIAMIGYQADPPLQAIYGFLSLLILGLAATRPVRERFI